MSRKKALLGAMLPMILASDMPHLRQPGEEKPVKVTDPNVLARKSRAEAAIIKAAEEKRQRKAIVKSRNQKHR